MRSIRCRARLTIGRAALVSSLGATIAYAGQSETAVVGRVLDAVTANPIARATVALSGQDAIPMTTRTDATGHFVFGAVRDPMVYLRASRLGYVSGGFGQHAPGRRERAVYLRQGEANSVVLHLFKNSVVSGRVHESTGEVVVGARVRAFRETSQLGRRKFLPAGVAERSDDTGAYRLAGLLPGRYLIVAGPGTTDDEGRVSVFHPGRRSLTPDLVFDLEPAEERQHVNILMPGVSGVAITGAIVGLPQDRIVDVRLQHCDASNPPIDLDLARFRSVPPHRFRFQNLAPGVYCLRFASFPVGQFPRQQRGGIVVNRAGGTATGVPREVIMQDDSYFGSAQVGVVDTDVDGVNLAAETGARISGRVVIEDQAPEEAPADLPGISVLVYSADGTDLGDGMPVPGVDQMGRFTTPGLPLGKYVLDVRTSGRRLYLRHITLAGQDHTRRTTRRGRPTAATWCSRLRRARRTASPARARFPR